MSGYNLRKSQRLIGKSGAKPMNTSSSNTCTATDNATTMEKPRGRPVEADVDRVHPGSSPRGDPLTSVDKRDILASIEEVKNMFTSHTKQVNSKLDFVIEEFDKIKQDLTVTKRQIAGLEQSVTFTSDKVVFMEKRSYPNCTN